MHWARAASQLRGKPCVLPLFANGKGKLMIRHNDFCTLFFPVQRDSQHLGRAERSRNKLLRVLAPVDDVNFFAAQLADNHVYAAEDTDAEGEDFEETDEPIED